MTTIDRRGFIAALGAAAVPAPAWPSPPQVARLRTEFKPFTGDFDAMLERRLIRMICPYSRTLFFRDKGDVYGTAVDGAQTFETWVNKTYKTGARPVTVDLVPVSRDKLFDALLDGKGDFAAGDITITPERANRVAFTMPVINDVKEVLVTAATVPDMASADALSDREVATKASTTYYLDLQALNARLAAAGRPAVTITLVPDTLEDEDLMDMVAAGLLPAIVVDDWVARLWGRSLKGSSCIPRRCCAMAPRSAGRFGRR